MRDILIFFSLFLILLNLTFSSEEYRIAYRDGKSIKVIDLKRKIIDKIELPRSIENFSFAKDKRKVIYDEAREKGKRDIFIFDLEKKIETRITKGPYLYKKKKFYGEERYFNPQISPDDKYIAFDFAPEFVIDAPNGHIWNVRELYEIGIIEIETGKFQLVTDDSFDDEYPMWSPNGKKIAFWTEGGIRIYHIEKKLFEEISPDGELFPIEWIDDYTIVVQRYAYYPIEGDMPKFFENELIIYNIKTKKKKTLQDLMKITKEFKIPNESFLSVESVSKDLNFCIITNSKGGGLKEWDIFILDLEKKEIKKIAEAKAGNPNPIFLN